MAMARKYVLKASNVRVSHKLGDPINEPELLDTNLRVVDGEICIAPNPVALAPP